MTKAQISTQEELKLFDKFFNIDSWNGKIYWKKSPNRNIKIGDNAERIIPKRYRQVMIKGKQWYYYRFIWWQHYKVFPFSHLQIDHINRITDDNRIANLRLVTGSVNMKNQQNIIGVCYHSQSGGW